MSDTRSVYSAEFKAKIATIAIWETMTIWEICSKYELHSSQVCRWKKELTERSKEIFEDKRKKEIDNRDEQIDKLYKQVWMLTLENNWLKKKSGLA